MLSHDEAEHDEGDDDIDEALHLLNRAQRPLLDEFMDAE
jgi:hypothetical protein